MTNSDREQSDAGGEGTSADQDCDLSNDGTTTAASPGVVEAYEAGYRAGVAFEIGIRRVIFRRDADRYPWQIFCTDQRCVIVSRDFKDHMLLTSEFHEPDRNYQVSVETMPSKVLGIVRRELYGAGR